MNRHNPMDPLLGTVHVLPDPERGWRVMVEGNLRASRYAITQSTAIVYARGLAMRKHTRLFIHDRCGRIREQHSYR